MAFPALVVAALLAQAAPGDISQSTELNAPPPEPEQGVPWYLPREFELGTFLQKGTVSPFLRLGWQLTILQSRHDALVFLIEGGPGYALVLPSGGFGTRGTPMTLLYQHTVMGGVAYRGTYETGFRWGFSAVTGPVWYGAHFKFELPPENVVDGWVEGRVQAGYQLGPVSLLGSLGYAGLYNTPRSFIRSGPYVGGLQFGIVIDWRPLARPNSIF